MDMEFLVEKVVREVLTRLSQEGLNKRHTEKLAEKEQLLAILPRHIINMDKYIEFLLSAYPSHRLTLMAPKNLHNRINQKAASIKLLDIEDKGLTGKILDEFCNFDAVCCIAPGTRLMESISNLDDTDITAYMVINAVLHGKKAVLVIDHLLRSSLEGAIYKKINEVISRIKDLGIGIEFVSSDGQREFKREVNENDLITEKDIIEFYEEGIKELTINRGAIITPLAIDRAKETGIEILIKES